MLRGGGVTGGIPPGALRFFTAVTSPTPERARAAAILFPPVTDRPAKASRRRNPGDRPMVLEMQFVRNTYSQLLAHEMKKVLRMVRQYPHDRFDLREDACGHTARELAEVSVAHLQRIEAIATDEPMPPAPIGPRPRGAILEDLESTFLSARTSLTSLPRSHWAEIVRTPPGLVFWTQARRSELLWLALREMAQHHRHFSMHSRHECNGGGHDDGGRRADTPEIPIETAALGA